MGLITAPRGRGSHSLISGHSGGQSDWCAAPSQCSQSVAGSGREQGLVFTQAAGHVLSVQKQAKRQQRDVGGLRGLSSVLSPPTSISRRQLSLYVIRKVR